MNDLSCVCVWDGRLIVACTSWDIADAVRRHQATPEHLLARKRRENNEASRAYRARQRAAVDLVRLARDLERERVA